MTHIDSKTKCKCGHGREEHSLLDGVHGDGLCGNMRCDCEMFQLPWDEPLPEAAPSQMVAALPQQPPQEAEAKNALERMAANRYMNWQNAGGPNECKHGYAAGIPCPSCDSETLVSAGIVSKPSPAPPTPAAGKSFEEPKQVESGEGSKLAPEDGDRNPRCHWCKYMLQMSCYQEWVVPLSSIESSKHCLKSPNGHHEPTREVESGDGLPPLAKEDRIERTVKCDACGWYTPGVPYGELIAAKQEVERLKGLLREVYMGMTSDTTGDEFDELTQKVYAAAVTGE